MQEVNQFQDLFTELSAYEKYGINISMEGEPVSAMQIISAYMLKEDSHYMRDYVMDEKGHIDELCFYQLDCGSRQ